ncbi:MAG: ATPase P [Ktedonobacterales bacterium]|nr:ATPase P [Ktedonobacterales bacterium]
MLRMTIPGRAVLELEHLVCDMNGTLAEDGQLFEGVTGRLVRLSADLHIHLLSADTHGTLDAVVDELRVACVGAGQPTPTWERVTSGADKDRYVRRLGIERVAALGNGANDEAMLRGVALGVAVIGSEGVYGPALLAARVVARSPLEALDLLLYPERLIATMRV